MNGVHDPRLGTTDRDGYCKICGCDSIECPGHFGNRKLVRKVFHPGYVTNVHKVLKCVCYNCGVLLKPDLRDPSKKLFKEIM